MAKRILVIEDEAAIRDLICMNLEVAGYETVVFGEGWLCIIAGAFRISDSGHISDSER